MASLKTTKKKGKAVFNILLPPPPPVDMMSRTRYRIPVPEEGELISEAMELPPPLDFSEEPLFSKFKNIGILKKSYGFIEKAGLPPYKEEKLEEPEEEPLETEPLKEEPLEKQTKKIEKQKKKELKKIQKPKIPKSEILPFGETVEELKKEKEPKEPSFFTELVKGVNLKKEEVKDLIEKKKAKKEKRKKELDRQHLKELIKIQKERPQEQIEEIAKTEIEAAIEQLKGKKITPKKREEKEETPEEELAYVEKELEVLEEPADDISRIYKRIAEARDALAYFHFDKAKHIYLDIVRLYERLSPKNKTRVYSAIKDLYNERKEAEIIAKG